MSWFLYFSPPALVAAITSVLVPVAWLGWQYRTCLAVTIVTFAFVATGVRLGRQKWFEVATIFVTVAAITLFSRVLLVQCIATFLAGAFLVDRVRRPSTWLACYLIATAGGYAWGLSIAWSESRQIGEPAAKWSNANLTDRLAALSGIESDTTTLPYLTYEQERRIESRDMWIHNSMVLWTDGRLLRWDKNREQRIPAIQDPVHRAAAIARGFAVSLVAPVASYGREDPEQFRDRPILAAFELESTSFVELHSICEGSFLRRCDEGRDYSTGRRMGFTPHGFSELPNPEPTEGSTLWRVDRVELISLRTSSEPMVYESVALPDLTRPSSLSRRPLDEFEASSIAKLREESDVQIDDSDPEGGVRMVGAIRASSSCVDCHRALHGTLLGVFSYDLVELDESPTESEAAN